MPRTKTELPKTKPTPPKSETEPSFGDLVAGQLKAAAGIVAGFTSGALINDPGCVKLVAEAMAIPEIGEDGWSKITTEEASRWSKRAQRAIRGLEQWFKDRMRGT